MAIAMEWGWDWDTYLDCWPAKWRFVVDGKEALKKAREEQQNA